ncbi:hypothetical protein Ancab_023982 [Ancistrocladus abbreviatus]
MQVLILSSKPSLISRPGPWRGTERIPVPFVFSKMFEVGRLPDKLITWGCPKEVIADRWTVDADDIQRPRLDPFVVHGP